MGTEADYGKTLFKDNLCINPRESKLIKIARGPRIGIKKAIDKPWRLWILDSEFIST